jgi:AGCS family alanine or glycine:cation symporter
MTGLMGILEAVNAVLWHEIVLLIVLGVGILFTLWSGFGQYRALTHGVRVISGHYDRKGDPGAISHFQALSAALSATVGLGNIAGVALAISLGGPGAVFWMWVTGLAGMALKMTEVTLAMLYRNLKDPQNPHGGAMWVASKGLGRFGPGPAKLGTLVGGIFCVTLLISSFTGGNMFQAWNVADISHEYFGIPIVVTGIVQMVLVGLVILGGIHRIGAVAGKLVPIMCGLYIVAGLGVILSRADQVPATLHLILHSAFLPSEAQGAFLGGAAGWAFLRGMQRALFSNEAGQGSAPIAHCAARTDEPVREGIVAGLEPFIDTICVCTITALVILLSGAWNRGPDILFAQPPAVVAGSPGHWTLEPVALAESQEDRWQDGEAIFTIIRGDLNQRQGTARARLYGELERKDGKAWVRWSEVAGSVPVTLDSQGAYFDHKGATLTAKAFDRVLPGLGFWLVPAVAWLFALSTMISWSYYGEQGTIFLFGERSVKAYRVIYCLLILVASTPLIRTEAELDIISSLGTGVMLFANIPIMLLFGRQTMGEYHAYIRRLKSGQMEPSEPERPPATEAL